MSLETIANKLEQKLEKFTLPFANSNMTARRARFQSSAIQEREALEAKLKQLKSLLSLADSPLHQIKHMTTLETVYSVADRARSTLERNWTHVTIPQIAEDSFKPQMKNEGIRNPAELLEAAQFLIAFNKPVDNTESKLKKKEGYISRCKIQGFFPTPNELIDNMLTEAHEQLHKENVSVLEPQAGMGHIADKIKQANPQAKLSLIERDSDLREYLELKGYSVAAYDSFQYSGDHELIICNPPFEHNNDIKHVMHSFNYQLAKNGLLIAIMNEMTFIKTTKLHDEFSEFLDQNGHSYKNGDKAFSQAYRKTNTQTRTVVLRK